MSNLQSKARLSYDEIDDPYRDKGSYVILHKVDVSYSCWLWAIQNFHSCWFDSLGRQYQKLDQSDYLHLSGVIS